MLRWTASAGELSARLCESTNRRNRRNFSACHAQLKHLVRFRSRYGFTGTGGRIQAKGFLDAAAQDCTEPGQAITCLVEVGDESKG